MRSDDGANATWLAVAAVEEGSGGLDQGLDAGEQFAVRDLTAELPPEPLDRVQSRAVGRKI